MLNSKDLLILSKDLFSNDIKEYLLKLDRQNKELLLYKSVSVMEIRKHYSLREDYDLNRVLGYKLVREFPCIFGGNETPTPEGFFTIIFKSSDEYISHYYGKNRPVKFFGYFVMFEDYFIHSKLYSVDTKRCEINSETGKNNRIGNLDSSTKGCVRISQDDLDWLLEKIEVGTMVIL